MKKNENEKMSKNDALWIISKLKKFLNFSGSFLANAIWHGW